MKEGSYTLDSETAVETAWKDQAIWSETANHLKKDLTWWRNFAAVAGVSGAFLETLAAVLPGHVGGWKFLPSIIALVGAIILSIVPYVMKTKTSKDQIRDWVRARSASEALKEIIYRYLIRTSPFLSDSSPADLINRCRIVKEKVGDLSIHTASVDPSTKKRPYSLTVKGLYRKKNQRSGR
jgi:hypothetical protein